jgi:hypothetical protein
MDALLAALKSVAEENGLTRFDIGYFPMSHITDAAHCTGWYAAPVGVIGCSSAQADTLDAAIEKMLADKAASLSPETHSIAA